MVDQEIGSSCSISNSCTPSINIDTYVASRESLPNIHDVSRERFKNNFKASEFKRPNRNGFNAIDEDTSSSSLTSSNNFLRESFSGPIISKKPQLCLSKENNVNNFETKGIKDKFKNELGIGYEILAEKKIVDNSWETTFTSDGKGRNYNGHNTSIRIKVTLNSESLKKLKSKPKRSRENCALEIELNGNNNKTLKITNLKRAQAKSIVFKEHTSTNKVQVVDCKEADLAKGYSTTISKTIKHHQKTFKESNLDNPLLLLTQYETFKRKRIIPEVVSTSLPTKLIAKKDEYKARKTSSLPYRAKPILCFSDSKLAKSNEHQNRVYRSKTENLMQDKFVQTTMKIVKEDTDLTEDQDLLKLGMWLEILNNSEYNIYNQEFCITTPNERIKLDEARNIENERDFQLFLKEIGQYKSHSNVRRMKSHCNLGCAPGKCSFKQKDDSYFMQHYGNQDNQSLVKNMKCCSTKDPSMESINLTDVNPSEEVGGKEKRNHFYTNLLKKHFSSSSEGPIKKIIQNVLMRLVPNASNEGKIVANKPEGHSFFAFFNLSENNSPNLWSKINPFKFCFIKNREKPFSKILEERKKSLNNIWECNSDTFQYSSLPTNDNNDFNYYRPPPCNSVNNFFNTNYFNHSYQTYFNNNSLSSNRVAPNYPYDTIPFMQCPGGCDLCNPDLNKVENINNVPNLF